MSSTLREYTESLVVAVLIALLLRLFVISAYKIPTPSMMPTLQVGDFIFAYKLPYGIRMPVTNHLLTAPVLPERGDVIVFIHPEERVSYIKRVVGLPGDKVEIRSKRLIVNDQMLEYLPVSEQEAEKLLPPHMQSLFILEKERNSSGEHFVTFRRGEDDDSYGPEVIPPGKIFVLGDNRDSSSDSRYWGLVPLENVEGRAVLIWLSLDWDQKSVMGFPLIRYSRGFTWVD